MKKFFLVLLILITGVICSDAQKSCVSSSYWLKEGAADPAFLNRLNAIEEFTGNVQSTSSNSRTEQILANQVIRIPVVFHVLYKVPGENISNEAIRQQLAIINRDFNRKNADTVNTPERFRFLAADLKIEFVLATSDPLKRSTNGINKKYTPVSFWYSGDKMKFSSETGADAWDTRSYLNIWVCNLRDGMGYSSLPGQDPLKDGVVLDYRTIAGNTSVYNNGRTAVHEIGHWLNLRHLWGEGFCGDDFVDDTPKQATYTPGCPSGSIRLSCSNGPAGDMYMNYMDFTDDACMNMFTQGQKTRARSLFLTGGYRNSILFSKGLEEPLVYQSALPDFYPEWNQVRVFPNPATDRLNINFEYDERWLGKELQVLDISGRLLERKIINLKIVSIDVSRLKPGIYFIRASKDDETLHQKFIKM